MTQLYFSSCCPAAKLRLRVRSLVAFRRYPHSHLNRVNCGFAARCAARERNFGNIDDWSLKKTGEQAFD